MSLRLTILLALAACSPEPADTAATEGEPTGPHDTDADLDLASWSILPPSLDLGETPVGEPVEALLTIGNTGSVDLHLLDPDGGDDGIELTLGGVSPLPPGSSATIDLLWTPTAYGALDSELSLWVGASPDEAALVEVPVEGTALGAVPTLSVSSFDFGEIGVGCEEDLEVTITNTGNADLQVDGVRLDSADGYAIYAATDLPWVLGPFESRDQRVEFEAETIGMVTSALWFETDAGTVGTELSATGLVDEVTTLSFDIGEQVDSTAIFNVNQAAIPGNYADRYSELLEDALPTFFETLLSYDAAFRVAFVVGVEGKVDGEVAYIDESYTAEEATDLVLGMLEPGLDAGDNDANFRTLLAAIDENQDWLFEDEGWSASQLNLVAIQNDQEQSGGSWSSWVSKAQAYKSNPDHVVFHAIAGPIPSGCMGADPFRNYDQAVTATGGAFESVCSTDWTSVMATLAVACLDNPQGTFALEGKPIEESIELSYDGELQTEGWSFDEEKNAVIVDDDALPAFGSTVEISYWHAGDCE